MNEISRSLSFAVAGLIFSALSYFIFSFFREDYPHASMITFTICVLAAAIYSCVGVYKLFIAVRKNSR